LYFNFFSASFCTTILSAGIATFISVHYYSYYYYYYYYYILSLITSRHFSCFSAQHSMHLTDQALLVHCSTKHFLTVEHVLSTTACSIRM
jgi:hypothetical protein